MPPSGLDRVVLKRLKVWETGNMMKRRCMLLVRRMTIYPLEMIYYDNMNTRPYILTHAHELVFLSP